MRHVQMLFLLPLVAVAAPVPKEKLTPDERLARYWGKAVLPDDKCTAVADAGSLTLTSDGGCRPELFETTAKSGTGVRSEWPASGDFEATVKLVCTTEPSYAAPRRGRDASVWSGLYVGGISRHDVKGYVWLGRKLRADEDNGRKVFDYSLWLQNAGTGSLYDRTSPDQEVWVRITRRDGKWACGSSADGKKWSLSKVDAELCDAVTVGVFLTHDVDQKCEAVFADFSVVQPKGEKK